MPAGGGAWVRYATGMASVVSGISVAEIGALVGDVARANMLHALMAGRALTAGELAWVGGVAAPTASEHLSKMVEARLIIVQKQGRHRYYSLASAAVAHMLEGIAAVAAIQSPPRHRPASRIDNALRTGRLCYDHLAGHLGVALADSLVEKNCVLLSVDGGIVTPAGRRFLGDWGIDLGEAELERRHFCRPCLDWSERRNHLAGAVGAALAARCFDLGWIERTKDSRAVAVTQAGRSGFKERFGIELEK